MIPWHLCLSVMGGVVGVVISHSTPPPPHPRNLSHIYMIPWHLCLSVRGWGVVISHSTPHPTPKFKSYLWYPDIYVWVSGVGWWGWLFLIQPPTTPPPKFKSYLWYPDIYVWVSGVGVVGWWLFLIQPHPTTPPWKFKSYLWYPDIYVWVLGVGSHHIHKINFNKYVIPIKIIFHFYFFQNKAVPSADM